MGNGKKRPKKLVAVAYATGNYIPKMFPTNCYTCTRKRELGCTAPFKKKVIWKTDFCPFCEGKNPKCLICKGFGTINMHQCPNAQVREVSKIISYYSVYKSFGHFPSSGGQLNQTIDVLNAFSILDQSIRLLEDYKNNKIKKENKGKA